MGCRLFAMERMGSMSKQALLLAAAIAGLAMAVPAGQWLGKPRPVSGTVPAAALLVEFLIAPFTAPLVNTCGR